MADVRNENNRNLNIDNVLTTQPELGPSIPDGGYGWVILLAAIFFQLLIPSIITAYGIFMVFLRLENSGPSFPHLWDNPLIYAPIFFVATWTFIDPWTRTLISNSIWPRLCATSGVCLTCSGLLSVWLAIHTGSESASLFVISGIFSGAGASIVISQCEVIIGQYFKLKLKHVNTAMQVMMSIGFIFTPVLLGKYIIKDGLLSVILWYQIIILQGMVICVFLKKPPYLKGTGKFYKLIQGMSDDVDVDIFAKNTTELQNTRHSINEGNADSQNISFDNASNSKDIVTSNHKTENPSLQTSPNKSQDENVANIEIHSVENRRAGWEHFEEDTSVKTNVNIQVHQNLDKSYVPDSNDLERIESFEDSFVHVPKPLFLENQVNNNTSYSYDNAATTTEEPVVFMPVKNVERGKFEKELYFIKQPTFYKSLLQIITLKFSTFIFFALFPSYLYMRIEYIRIHHVTYIIGCIGLSGLLFSIFFTFITTDTYRRALFLWIFSWTGSLGYIIISDVRNETWLIIGAIQVSLSIHALQYFGGPLLKLNLRGETNRAHMILSTISGLAFFLFFGIDFNYINCFRMMSLLQFIMGSIWFANFLFKKIKPMFSNS